jgi:hypothetical protein
MLPGRHGSDRATADPGDLRIGDSFHFTQDEDDAEVLGKPADRVRQTLTQELPPKDLIRRRRRLDGAIVDRGIHENPVRIDCTLPSPSAHDLAQCVADDSIQVGRECRTGAIAARGPQDAQEAVVSNIPRHIFVAAQPVGEGKRSLMVSLDEFTEGPGVAGGDPTHELGIRITFGFSMIRCHGHLAPLPRVNAGGRSFLHEKSPETSPP